MQTIIILVFIALGLGLLYILVSKKLEQQQPVEDLEKLIDQVFGKSVEKIAAQSKQILAGEKETIKADLENKQQNFEKLVREIKEQVHTQQKEIRQVEQDRVKKFSQLTKALEEHRKQTDDLKVSTRQLSKVLSNNQARGEWGERIIEDLLQANGLVEGVHYLRQKNLGSSQLKPDITLLLPNERYVPVDVKFPYSEMQKMSLAESKSQKKTHLTQFSRDLRTKIDKVAEYISPEQDTLDYAILFVPNEMVFSFINQRLPDLVDRAIGKRVIIVSPFTFLIVARTVIESYRNFMIGDKLKEVVKYVDEFVDEWDRFKDEFAKFGRAIDTMRKSYKQMVGTRTRQMERRIKRIDVLRQGSILLDEGEQQDSLAETND